MSFLRLNLHTYIEIIFLADEAEHNFCDVSVGRILRETAEILIEIVRERLNIIAIEEIHPSAIDHLLVSHITEAAEIIRVTITLTVRVLVLIAELKEGSMRNRLRVSSLQLIVPVLCRSRVVSVCLISGIQSSGCLHLIEMHVSSTKAVAFAFREASIYTQSDVTSEVIELSVKLEHTITIL